MNWNELIVNAESLHWVTGWSIEKCKKLFKHECLPNKTSLGAIAWRIEDFDPEHYRVLFEKNWFKYHENREFMLNDPFRVQKDGRYEFKRSKKLNFIIGILPDDQVKEIEKNWEEKQKLLNAQLSYE